VQVEEASRILDPNILTLGLARRFAEYKRPNLLLRDPERLAHLLNDEKHPVQLIVAGKAHPDDLEGQRLIQAWLEYVRRPDVRRSTVFLEDYDMALAQQLVQGVDAWINTPRRLWEACGTSGMKTLVNGGLNLSELDGWWAEAYQPEYGWAIDGDGDDAADADQLYRILEQEVVPAFYQRDAAGVPHQWVQRMRASMSKLAPQFSSNRMLLEYQRMFYRPAADAFHRRREQGARLARELRAWEKSLANDWHEVHLGSIEVRQQGVDRYLDVPVYLGGIDPHMVKVELYASADDQWPGECLPMTMSAALQGAVQGYLCTATLPTPRPASHYTPRVRAWHSDAFLPAESTLVAWQR
jgi:starch phosphorylase